MIAELEIEKRQNADSHQRTLDGVRENMRIVDERLGRLMKAYLEEAISLDEYRFEKNTRVNDKRRLEDQIIALEKNRSSWLEPAIRFVEASKQAGFWAETGTVEEKRDFLKKVGSNLQISNRTLTLVPRGAWELVVDQGSFAQRNTAPSHGGAAFFGETHQISTERRR
jgi:hypothetical protein